MSGGFSSCHLASQIFWSRHVTLEENVWLAYLQLTQQASSGGRQPQSTSDVEAQVRHLQVAGVLVVVKENQKADILGQLDPAALVVVHGNRHTLPRH